MQCSAGAFGSRLNMNLREDKHWTYGAHSTSRRRSAPVRGRDLRTGADRPDRRAIGETLGDFSAIGGGQATMRRAAALGVSANRITVLRDRDGDGVAEARGAFSWKG